MKELCQLCGTRVRLSKIKHVSVGFTLLRCYTFMLKKFTFSLSKNTDRPTVVWTSFLAFSFPVTSVLFMCGQSSPETLPDEVSPPNVVEIPPNHTHQKKNVSYSWHLTRVVVLYTSLRLVEGVYKPQRACFGWWFACVMNEPVWQNRVSKRTCKSNAPVWTKVSPMPPHSKKKIYPAKFRKNHHK